MDRSCVPALGKLRSGSGRFGKVEVRKSNKKIWIRLGAARNGKEIWIRLGAARSGPVRLGWIRRR